MLLVITDIQKILINASRPIDADNGIRWREHGIIGYFVVTSWPSQQRRISIEN
jgi:hypothetical protein